MTTALYCFGLYLYFSPTSSFQHLTVVANSMYVIRLSVLISLGLARNRRAVSHRKSCTLLSHSHSLHLSLSLSVYLSSILFSPTRPGTFCLIRKLIHNKGFPLALYSYGVPETPKKNFTPTEVKNKSATPFLPVFSALDENSNFSLDWSRDKSEGTKMISALALVGVGAGIKSLSHLVN